MLLVLLVLLCLIPCLTAKGDVSSSQKKFEEYYWADWTGWSSCDRLCARSDGSKSRIRICFRVANTQRLIGDSRTCEARLNGQARETEDCYEVECDGTGAFTAMWSPWQSWICSYDQGICGKGTKTRNRHCSNPESVSLNAGRVSNSRCPPGKAMEEDDCFAKCPDQVQKEKYGGWSKWSPWKCEQECTEGVRAVRIRVCDNPPPLKGYTCPGKKRMVKQCAGLCRKSWGEWGDWTGCHKTCDQPLRTRKHKCEGFGLPCEGKARDQSECMDKSRHTLCPPVDGGWGVWSHWTTECSVTCGNGVKIRQRECNRPSQAGLGADCAGHTNLTRPCVTGQVCPIHGEWLEWSEWVACTASCGGGEGRRTRKCTKPKYKGRPCDGPATETGICNAQTCPPPTVAPALANKLDEHIQDSEFSIVAEEGEVAEMICSDMDSVQTYYADATSLWEKNGEALTLDGLRVRLERRTLVFEELKPEDSGVYLCQAEYGGLEKLIVAIYALAVKSQRAEISVHEGQDFELTCNGVQLGLLFEGCTQKWFKDDRAVKTYGDMQPQEINVENFRGVDKRFSGSYSCIVYHTATDRQWTTNIVNVTVLPPLGLVDIIMAKVKTNVKLAGGVAGGATGLFSIVVCMCIITCRSKGDKDTAKPSTESKKNAQNSGNAGGEHVALYGDDNIGTTDYNYDNTAGYYDAGTTDYNYDNSTSYQQTDYGNTGY